MLLFPLRVLFRQTVAIPTVQPVVALHSTNQLNRWYKALLRIKRAPEPPNPLLSFPNDWEAVPYQPLPPDAVSPQVKTLPGFDSLNPDVQKVFSVQYKLTNRVLYRATRALVHARWYELRRLRATNLPEFVRLCEALNITGYKHIDPLEFPTTDPVVLRKRAVREECYRTRLLKLANCKLNIAKTEPVFYKRKQEQLEQLIDRLATLDQPSEDTGSAEAKRERAKLVLEQLFDDVVEQRQNEVLREYQNDSLSWYVKEQEMRAQYLARKAEKEEKQLRKKR